MKKLFLLLFVLHFVSYGQKADGLEICFEVQKSLKGFAADKEADDALEEILAVIGAAKNFYLIPCDEINNALALTYKGERFILYDKDFIERINKVTNDWSGKFILAHEVGHHINGHTRDFLIASVLDGQTKEKQREEELEADEFAGFIVAKLGAKYNQIKELMNTISSEKDDKYSTHPNRSKRLEAIKKGFDKVKILNPKQEQVVVKIPKQTTSTTHSDWKTLTEYPSERIKESNNPFKVEKKYNSSIEVIKTSMVEGELIEDNTKNWPSWVSELGRMIKNEISDFGKPYIEIVQYKYKLSQNIYSDVYIQLPELEYLFQYEKTIDYSFEIYIDDYKFYSHTDRLWGLDRSYLNGEIEYSSYSWDKHREDQSQTKVLVAMKDIDSFISHLKKGKKMFLKINIERELPLGSGGWNDSKLKHYKLHPFYNYCSSECFNTYEFSLSGSSKALSF